MPNDEDVVLARALIFIGCWELPEWMASPPKEPEWPAPKIPDKRRIDELQKAKDELEAEVLRLQTRLRRVKRNPELRLVSYVRMFGVDETATKDPWLRTLIEHDWKYKTASRKLGVRPMDLQQHVLKLCIRSQTG